MISGLIIEDIRVKSTEKISKKSGLKNKLIMLSVTPLFFMGIFVMIFAYYSGYKTVSSEVGRGLKTIADATLYSYERLYDNDIYFLDRGDGSYSPDTERNPDIASDTAFIDYISEKTDTEVSIAYYDIRLLTTLKDEDGNGLAGTVISKRVVDEAFASGDAVFYDNLMIGNDNYYACYVPVRDDTGKCIGLVAAGKPTSYVKKEVLGSNLLIIVIALVMMLIGAMVGAGEAAKLAHVIDKEKKFLGEIADGNLRANLDADILKRPDELGEMGKFTVHVQRFIRDMIERDALTKLYTRRIGEARLSDTRLKLIQDGVPFQLVMADIDHFKRFNDTYGHDCGDLVLQTVAGVFNRKLIGKGYPIRWGGEEFIIVYEDMTYEDAYEHLKTVREAIINEVVEYKDERLSITMTFGLILGSDKELDDIIKDADKLLYIGKEGGRDRIVRYDSYEDTVKNKEAVDKLKDDVLTENADSISKEKTADQSEEDRLTALMNGMI